MGSPLKIAKLWMDAMNAHDLDTMSALYAEDISALEIADPTEHDRVGLITSYVDLLSAYPDCKAEILNTFEDSEQALIEIRWIGTNTGSFRGDEPTNKVSDLRIAYIFRVRNDRIVQMTEYYDSAQV
jgi:steroid delta-isomerase-like uncharacterized protein